ncbi:helix-turn-helix domain-containing protein [uncultured Phascolarctobacterium sp.]|uniref:helix-turn-helix domain-containing protein n=1 Tax=uncultured Phascolarctobacterium sp. TaxID=512296 RepID=UPI0025EE5E01|nr:helix-turn-helix transcriptional regulator [uncultured Phascolarctobacterium sp.]
MMHAYDKLYLDKARIALARMLDFAVYDLHYDISEFFELFLVSGIARRFEQGDFTILAGMSGVELAYTVLENVGLAQERIKPDYPVNRSEEYWTGWALAYYQWQTALRFAEINRYVPIKTVLSLYNPYHEMDIHQFTEKMTELYKEAKKDTNLKLLRLKAELTQRELAELAEVPLRTVQQYEQRQKNINRAQAETLARIAKQLYCNIEDLLEKV